jgi:hypothetical protein
MAGATYFTDPYRVTKFVIITLRPKNCICFPPKNSGWRDSFHGSVPCYKIRNNHTARQKLYCIALLRAVAKDAVFQAQPNTGKQINSLVSGQFCCHLFPCQKDLKSCFPPKIYGWRDVFHGSVPCYKIQNNHTVPQKLYCIAGAKDTVFQAQPSWFLDNVAVIFSPAKKT